MNHFLLPLVGAFVGLLILLPLVQNDLSLFLVLAQTQDENSNTLFATLVQQKQRQLTTVCDTNTPFSTQGTTTGYNTWEQMSGSNYNHKMYVPTSSDPCSGVMFHWSITGSMIQIAVAAFTGVPQGWVGLGFSETGGMRGADIVYYQSSTNTLVDSYVADEFAPPIQDVQQDWTLLDSTVTEDGYIIFEAQRLLVTDDNQDWPLVDDSPSFIANHRMIAAWGSSPVISYHGNNRAKSVVQLFLSENQPAGDGHAIFVQDMADRATGSVMLTLNDYTVPSQVTTYYTECFSYNKLTNTLGLPKTDIYIIGVEVFYPDEAKKYFHHMLVYGSTTLISQNLNQCSDYSFPWYGWAPGQDYMNLPNDTGFKFSNADVSAFNALVLEIHWDNRDLDQGITLSGMGVKMYYTTNSIENELGMLVTGDPLLALEDNSLGDGPVRFDFECSSSCTQSIPVEGITILQEGHHMHEKGKRMTSEIVRNGQVIRRAVTEYYDFEQSGLNIIRQEPYTVQRGDQFLVTCYYDSEDDTVFGMGSQDEMCMNFIWYYPKIITLAYCGPGVPFLAGCDASYDQKFLSPDTEFNRVFGSVSQKTDDDYNNNDNDNNTSSSSSFGSNRGQWSILLGLGIVMLFL